MGTSYQKQMFGASQQRSEDADRAEQMTGQGANPAPTRKPLADRSSAPDGYATSGMERAMHAHADKVHPVKRR